MKHRVTNNAGRRIGIPIRQAFVLNNGESREVTDGELAQMEANKTVRRWLDTGILSVGSRLGEDHSKAPPEVKKKARVEAKPEPKAATVDLPEGIEGEDIEYEHCGGGWYHLWVNGFCVTDKKVRKAEAETMAEDYE